MPEFKHQHGDKVWIEKSSHPVTIAGRTEFASGKENRYYVTSESQIPGKDGAEDWINEGALTTEAPPPPVVEAAEDGSADTNAEAVAKPGASEMPKAPDKKRKR